MAAKKRQPIKDLKVGTRLVQGIDSSHVYKVVKIDVTGNGARMLFLEAETNAKDSFARWESDIRGGHFSTSNWQVYRKPRVKKPKPLPTFVSRYELMDNMDDL